MAEPVRQKDRETYLARAEQARAEADAATLENVRERCLRSETAWLEMAFRDIPLPASKCSFWISS